MPRRLLLGIAALTGCAPPLLSEDKSQLPILRNDPLAAKNLLNLPLIEEHEKGFSRPLGKPSSAEVVRVFQIDESTERETFDAVRNLAKSTGWDDYNTTLMPDKTFWKGKKQNPNRICRVSISHDRPTALRITLIATEEL